MAKLIDILARELKVWPEDMEGAYSSGHLVRFCTGLGTSHTNVLDIGQEPIDQASTLVTRAEWQAALDALNAPKVVEWPESEYPAVGTVCEFTTNDGYNWKDCKILYADELSILTGELEGNADRRLLRKCDADVKFRHIRTSEQIAAERRTIQINEALSILPGEVRCKSVVERAVGILIDSGYIKP